MKTIDWMWFSSLGLGAGFLAGWLGIGGGALMVPVMIIAFGVDTKIAIATSLAAIVPIAIAAAGKHWIGGKVDWHIAGPMMVAGIVGGVLGAWMLDKVSTDWTKRALAIFLVYSAVRLWMTTMRIR
ncbi:MAG: sulfite exporter TauE/SafE family protein [Verrucomicrobiota bacterium]